MYPLKFDYFSISSELVCVEEEIERNDTKEKIDRLVGNANVTLCLMPRGVSTYIQDQSSGFNMTHAEDDALIILFFKVELSWESSNQAQETAAEKVAKIIQEQPHEIHPALKLASSEGLWEGIGHYAGEKYSYQIMKGDAPWTCKDVTSENLHELIEIAQHVLNWLVERDKELYALRWHRIGG